MSTLRSGASLLLPIFIFCSFIASSLFATALTPQAQVPGIEEAATGEVDCNAEGLCDHGDHLGSTGYTTSATGELQEYIGYTPHGEQIVREHPSQPVNYSFTNKEFDSETGYYYFGARYYDPRAAVWVSTDPALGEYVRGATNDGVFNARNLSLYAYAYNNPLILNDPDGRAPISSREWTGKEQLYQGATVATCSSVICNSNTYDRMDTSLATGRVPGAVRSDWFKAASHVTEFFGLGSLDFPNLMSSSTNDYLTKGHHALARENYALFGNLASGKGYKGLSGKALDYALVDKEQAFLTKFTKSHFGNDTAGRDKANAEINAYFDPDSFKFNAASGPTQSVIKERFQKNGMKFDIGNEAHRRQLGYGLVDYIRNERNRGD